MKVDAHAVVLAVTFLAQGTFCEMDQYPGCKKTYTMGYGYKNIYHITEFGEHKGNDELTLHFLVQAPSDAHVLLSPTATLGEADPVYEIVFGAGRNTFTDIRRRGRSQSKAKLLTIGILSNSEYRGFWIRLSPPGLIEVGTSGDDVPFLFWNDPVPLLIRYFSFSSWGLTIGRWIYSCPNETRSEEIEPANTLTTTEKLRQDLLTHYDPYSRPTLNETDVTFVFFHLTCHNINLDEKKSMLSLAGEVTMHWQDEKLRWNPRKYDNISFLPVLYHETWQPELVLYNAVGHGTDILSDTPLLVSSFGMVVWKSQINIKSWCNMNLNKWPKDLHTCEIQLGFWAQHEVLRLELIENGTSIKEQHSGSEWEVLALGADPTQFVMPWINTTYDLKSNKAVSIRLTLQRRTEAYKAIIVVPLFVVGTMTILSFWLSPLDSNKILFSCMSLVIMSMFLVALGGALPAPADHVPHLVFTYSHGMIALAISLIISVGVISTTRYTHAIPLPSLVRAFITAQPLKRMLFLPSIVTEKSTDYNTLQETAGDSCENSPVQDGYWEIQQYYILLATVIDRVACIVYTLYLSYVLYDHF